MLGIIIKRQICILFAPKPIAISIRLDGTLFKAEIVEIVNVKNTPIKTINMAVVFPIPKITNASGIHAIGAIGARRRITGEKNAFKYELMKINPPIIIAKKKPRKRPI